MAQAAPMLRLAGYRINPLTNGPHLAPRSTGLLLQSIATGEQRRIEVPKGANLGYQGWSPDGQWIAFTITTRDSIQLWVASVRDAVAQQFADVQINGCYGAPIQWLPDSSGLLVQSIVRDRGPAPIKPLTPSGPTIEESSGNSGPVRTYQDLLQNSHDEDLFEYYASSQLMRADLATMKLTTP